MVISEDYIFTSTFSLIKVRIRTLSVTENIHLTGSIFNMAINGIGGVMVKCARLEYGRSLVRATVVTIKLVFVASLLSTQR